MQTLQGRLRQRIHRVVVESDEEITRLLASFRSPDPVVGSVDGRDVRCLSRSRRLLNHFQVWYGLAFLLTFIFLQV